MVKTGREGWPWSERVMGIYHRYNGKSKSSVWIIVQPTVAACELPETFVSNAERSFLTAHRILIQSTSHSWRSYLDHLETEVGTDVLLSYMIASHLLPLANCCNRIVGLG